MATAAKQNSSTKRKKHKRGGIFCFTLGCCGSSSAEVRSSGESKLAKYQRYVKSSALPVVINPKTLSEDVVISSGREIHVVRAEEGRDNPDAPFEVQISKGSKGLSKLQSHPKTGELDPMFGAAIVMMALLVMLIWGKACAIFFTVACVLVVPQLRVSMLESYATNTSSDDDNNHGYLVEFDLWEYKKNAALQENNVQD